MPGYNTDPLNHPPAIQESLDAGVDAVRIVSRPDPNGPGVHPAIEQRLADLKAANIFALVVITSESRGRLPANNHGWFQFGNEPDVTSPASWTMSPDVYVDQFNLYSETYPQFHWVAAGLASGDYSAAWWRAVCPRLVNCVGFAVHPYAKAPADAEALIRAYQAVDPSKLAFATEFNCTAEELPEMLTRLHGCTAGQFWYSAVDYMNPGFGLLDHPDKLAAWCQGLEAIKYPKTPEPELWVDVSNFQKDLTDNMVRDMQSGGVVGIVSQAITGLDGRTYCRQQLQKAGESGLRQAGYVWCFPNSSVASRLHMFDGFSLEFLALDVEQAGTTVTAVNRDFALCDAYIGGVTEDYTARWFFENQGWLNYRIWANRPLWYALYDFERSLDDFVPFGGWTQPRMHQFSASEWFGGEPMDISIRYPNLPASLRRH